MATYPAADGFTEAVLQSRPGLVCLFDQRTVQEVESLAITKSFFSPMLRQFLATQVRKGCRLHLTDCFVHSDAHRSRRPFTPVSAEFVSADVKQFSVFPLIECTSCVLVICLEHT